MIHFTIEAKGIGDSSLCNLWSQLSQTLFGQWSFEITSVSSPWYSILFVSIRKSKSTFYYSCEQSKVHSSPWFATNWNTSQLRVLPRFQMCTSPHWIAMEHVCHISISCMIFIQKLWTFYLVNSNMVGVWIGKINAQEVHIRYITNSQFFWNNKREMWQRGP